MFVTISLEASMNENVCLPYRLFQSSMVGSLGGSRMLLVEQPIILHIYLKCGPCMMAAGSKHTHDREDHSDITNTYRSY